MCGRRRFMSKLMPLRERTPRAKVHFLPLRLCQNTDRTPPHGLRTSIQARPRQRSWQRSGRPRLCATFHRRHRKTSSSRDTEPRAKGWSELRRNTARQRSWRRKRQVGFLARIGNCLSRGLYFFKASSPDTGPGATKRQRRDTEQADCVANSASRRNNAPTPSASNWTQQ